MSLFSTHWRFIPVVSLAVLLAGCPGDYDTAATLGGTAATGAPIVGGNVNVKCAGGGALSGVTDSNGAWQVTLSGQTLPCAVEVSGGNLPGGQTYHSVALQSGTLNITPLTDLIVANLAGQTPGAWFGGLNANTISSTITSSAVNTALGNLRTALGLPALDDLNPLTATFTAAPGNRLDNVLEAMQSVFADYGALLEAATGSGFAAYAASFQTPLAEAYDALPTGGGGDGVLPAGLSSKMFDLTYQNAQAGSPFSNGDTLKFTFSGSGSLMLGDSYRDIGAFTVSGAEYIWFDAANNVAYAASLKPDGSLNEVNVAGSSSGTPWYGQFAEPAGGNDGDGEGGGDQGGDGGDSGAGGFEGNGVTGSINGTQITHQRLSVITGNLSVVMAAVGPTFDFAVTYGVGANGMVTIEAISDNLIDKWRMIFPEQVGTHTCSGANAATLQYVNGSTGPLSSSASAAGGTCTIEVLQVGTVYEANFSGSLQSTVPGNSGQMLEVSAGYLRINTQAANP